MKALIAQYWTKEQREALGGPADNYLLELMTIALEALEEKAPKRLDEMTRKTLAMYLYNQVLAAVSARNQIYRKLILESQEIKDPGEKQMAQMVARADSDAEMERMLREVTPDQKDRPTKTTGSTKKTQYSLAEGRKPGTRPMLKH